MESIEKFLGKLKEARKEKGYSHENMAHELDISQGAYTNIENNSLKLTIERFLKIAAILDKPTYYFFEATPNNVYNNNTLAEHSITYQQVQNLYQENKETHSKLVESYEVAIRNQKEEIAFLRGLVGK